jgi:hypothetical protein
MGLVVVLVYGVVLVSGNVVFGPVNRNSYFLRVDVVEWMWVVVWDAVSVVRVLVVVVCCVGRFVCVGGFVGIGPMWCVRGMCGWLVVGVGGGCTVVGVVGIWGIMVFVVVVMLRVHLPSLFLGQYGLMVYLTIF